MDKQVVQQHGLDSFAGRLATGRTFNFPLSTYPCRWPPRRIEKARKRGKSRENSFACKLHGGELVWWRKEYYDAFREHSEDHNLMYQPNFAVLIMVFKRPSLTSTSITTYDIDPNLTGKARARA